MAALRSVAFIFMGGGIGSVLRYAVSRWLQSGGSPFPWGTFAVNVAGCFLIGILGALYTAHPPQLREAHRLFLVVGVLGGFTTFSSFGWETVDLVNRGRPGMAALYAVASNVGGIGLAWLGYGVARAALAGR